MTLLDTSILGQTRLQRTEQRDRRAQAVTHTSIQRQPRRTQTHRFGHVVKTDRPRVGQIRDDVLERNPVNRPAENRLQHSQLALVPRNDQGLNWRPGVPGRAGVFNTLLMRDERRAAARVVRHDEMLGERRARGREVGETFGVEGHDARPPIQ